MNELSKEGVRQVEVDEASAGQRIDNFLGRILKGVPKSHVYRILRSGEVRLNGRRVDPQARIAAGDRLRIPPIRTSPEKPRAPAAPARALSVLYEDESLLALDKPSGLAVHGGSGIAHGLIESLRASRPQEQMLELVHRLDRETSGVLLVAKQRAALIDLHEQLREGSMDKRYIVLVRGRWRDEKRAVRLPLHKFATSEGERRVRVDDRMGREAVTVFHRLRIWRDREPPLALLEAELHTGRTHQIRVHLTHLGFPLAGDDKYGDFAWNRTLAKAGLKRMFLHAWKLRFTHPSTGKPIALEAPLPQDLSAFITSLDERPSTDA